MLLTTKDKPFLSATDESRLDVGDNFLLDSGRVWCSFLSNGTTFCLRSPVEV